MNEGHDDATQVGGNNSAEQFQPEPQTPQANGQQLNESQPSPSQPGAPQGIFSSGELAVNSENLEQIKPELSDENKSRIASAFAQTDATQKRDQLSEQMADQDAVSGTVLPAGAANGFGNGGAGGRGFGGANNATASTATGDIRIPGAKKKSKAPLLILALLVVLAVVGGVAWLTTQTKTDQPVVAELTKEEKAQQAFTRYASYILTGESQDDYSASDNLGEIEIEKRFSAQTKDSTFWNNSIELLKSAQKSYDELENRDESLTELLGYYLECLEFLNNRDSYPSTSIAAMTETYLRDGRNVLLSAVAETYSPYLENTSSVVANYAQVMILASEALANKLDFFVSSGCLVDGSLVAECVENFEDADEVPEVVEISDNLESTAEDFNGRTISSVVTGALNMLEEAQNFTQTQEQAEENNNE